MTTNGQYPGYATRKETFTRKNSLSGKSVSSPSRKNISLNPSGKSLI
jgi:hypothetical protein